MEDRITTNFMYVGLISALIALALSLFGFHHILSEQTQASLAQTAALLSRSYQSEPDGASLSASLPEHTAIAVLSGSGELLWQNTDQLIPAADPAALFKTVLADSQDAGTCSFDGNDLIYAAERLSDGATLCVITRAPSLLSILSTHYAYIILLAVILVAVSFFLAFHLTRRLLKPIKSLPAQIARVDFDGQNADVYPELIPLIHEITERRNERETMRQEFTANVSHELKTPLTTISGYSEMIANGLVRPEDIQRFAAKIHAESERMQSLVADIIELNALDSESSLEHAEPVELLPLVQDCVEQLSPHFIQKGLSVSITGSGFSVLGDRRQLWELIYNLLDNARRYNVEHGSIHISIEDHILSVRDTGIGIPPEHQSRVFERFYRVDKSHSRATGGTGLGLSIVKHVAELHHAEIELNSTEQVGTEIRILFPS